MFRFTWLAIMSSSPFRRLPIMKLPRCTRRETRIRYTSCFLLVSRLDDFAATGVETSLDAARRSAYATRRVSYSTTGSRHMSVAAVARRLVAAAAATHGGTSFVLNPL